MPAKVSHELDDQAPRRTVANCDRVHIVIISGTDGRSGYEFDRGLPKKKHGQHVSEAWWLSASSSSGRHTKYPSSGLRAAKQGHCFSRRSGSPSRSKAAGQLVIQYGNQLLQGSATNLIISRWSSFNLPIFPAYLLLLSSFLCATWSLKKP